MLPTPEPSQNRPSRTSRKRILQSDGTFSQSFYDKNDLSQFTLLPESIVSSKRRRKLSFQVLPDPAIYLEYSQREDSKYIAGFEIGLPDSSTEYDKSPLNTQESVSIREPLASIDTNVSSIRYIKECLKPDLTLHWASVKKWQKNQPNDHTSIIFYLLISYSLIYNSTLYPR